MGSHGDNGSYKSQLEELTREAAGDVMDEGDYDFFLGLGDQRSQAILVALAPLMPEQIIQVFEDGHDPSGMPPLNEAGLRGLRGIEAGLKLIHQKYGLHMGDEVERETRRIIRKDSVEAKS